MRARGAKACRPGSPACPAVRAKGRGGNDRESVSRASWNDWEWQLRHRVRSPAALARCLDRSRTSLSPWDAVVERYPLAITPYYLALLDPADETDPLRMQSFPDPREIGFSLGGVPDPLGEGEAMPVPGLIRRYPDRCLVLAAADCPVYCRHCNRKRMWPPKSRPPGKRRLKEMADYVAGTPSIREVIVSGGDPLLLSEDLLDWFLGLLRAIPHVEVLRIGSRTPVTLPMRITPGLCAMLKRHRPLWFNTQFNHPREITRESARACEMLLTAGIPVSNQSVLLRGINDDPRTMRELLYGLQRISVRPYYLFQCDAVEGTDHFRAEIRTGQEMMEALRCTVSGLCIPRYVQDARGGLGKIPLDSAGLPHPEGEGNILLTSGRKWIRK